MAIVLSNAEDVSVEGITLLDLPGWVVAMFESRRVRVDNVKEICRRENSDGVDICNSQEVLVENCFLRNNDDEVCVKTTAPAPAQTSEKILVRKCVIWNERRRGLGITSETRRRHLQRGLHGLRRHPRLFPERRLCGIGRARVGFGDDAECPF